MGEKIFGGTFVLFMWAVMILGITDCQKNTMVKMYIDEVKKIRCGESDG